ncbi:hypothetical protein N7462_004871 [Penicillium macrosclerotiorum]|uniref:uncharacterized protein n=1 Tax=Penicillium macrosclerotiorum TaxID=303699 RepID=UPI002548ECC9|nr:uncharacterized protein N7462_004871 [Penicillium macrosclerotiorum]KAJ5690479.1 hypothetical protein N7462_004871 [Penicillium macrosclerotiorum]
MYFTFDVMGEIAFSKDFKQLEHATEHFAIKAMHAQMNMIGLVGKVPWLIAVLSAIPGLGGPYKTFMKYTTEQIEKRKTVWYQETEKKPTDVVSWLLKAKDDGDPSAPPTDGALYDEGRLVIIAGSDTTGVTLAHILFYLATHPHVYQRLQKSVEEAGGTDNPMAPFPYVDAIINETLRLKPVVPSGQPRVTPPEGLVIDEVSIPGDTIIIVPQYLVQRDPRNFKLPLEFIPERWLDEQKELVLDDRAFYPFSIGPYICVGRQLAYLKLRMALISIAREFDISLAPGENGKSFNEDVKDTFTMEVQPLQMVFRRRTPES